MQISRRNFTAAAASAATLSLLPRHAFAQQLLPTLKVLVGYPAGGTTDATARRLAEGLRGSYAQATLVENKPGASGRIVLSELNRLPPDGGAMVVAPEAIVTLIPHVEPNIASVRLPDLVPVTSVGVLRIGLAVGPMVPANVKTVRDFLNWAKANPTQANYATPGLNSPQRFLMAALSRDTGVEFNHVPYKGSAPGVNDMIGGQIAAMVSPIGDSLPHLGTGRARLLGIFSEKRSSFVPDVPTLQEQGFNSISGDETFGVLMAKGTPMEAANRLARAIATIVALPDTAAAFSKIGLEPLAMMPVDYARVLEQNNARWGERVKASGFKPES